MAFCVAAAWLTLALSPSSALACPACAGRQDGGVMRGILLATFIFLPFAIVALVIRFIRSSAADDALYVSGGLRDVASTDANSARDRQARGGQARASQARDSQAQSARAPQKLTTLESAP